MQKKLTYEELERKCRLLEAKEIERVKNQKKLQVEYKKEAVETLAGGIAHKFNNALSGIIGNIELLKLEASDTKRIDEYTNRMMAAARKMTELSSRLLAYAEGGKYQAEPLALGEFIKNTTLSISNKFSPDIKIKTETPDDMSKIKGDPVQIQILLTAILENAAEAVKDNGRIWVIAQDHVVDTEFSLKRPGLKQGSYIYLRVIDDGKGMDKNTKSRIFDPFFTTNFQGRGLGMSAAWGIVKSHNGWIDVESEPDKGTCTTVFLPTIKPGASKALTLDIDTTKNTGTVLLVEDEKIVLDVERAMMKRLGYKVLIAQCGKEALDILNDHNKKIDLVLLDLALPDITGQDLYPLLKEIRSDLKVIVCSGYSVDGTAQPLLEQGAQGFLQKPFRLAELSELLKQHIDRRKYKRFQLNKDATARPQNKSKDQCRIIDISVGGLAFCYKEKNERFHQNPEKSINLCMNSFNLGDIPFKTISDSPVDEKSGRCSIQFVDLSPNHVNQLDSFIKSQARL